MKKYYLLLLLLSLTSLVRAQHFVGVRGGYGLSNAHYVPFKKTSSVRGLDYGIAYKIYSPDTSSLRGGVQLELNHILKGYKAVVADTTFKSSAVELPAMGQLFYQFKIGNTSYGRLFIGGGVYMSYILKTNITHKKSGSELTEAYSFTDRDNRFEYGIMGSAGVAFGIGRIELQADFRYQYAMNFIVKPRYKNQPTVFGNSNRLVFSLGAFYRLSSKS